MILDYDEFDSPIGRLPFASCGDGICALGFDGYQKKLEVLFARRFGEFQIRRGSDPYRLKAILRRYFEGDLAAGAGSECQCDR